MADQFLPLRFNEALELMKTDQEKNLNTKLDFSDNKLCYQYTAVMARVYDLLAQQCENTFASKDLSGATGPQLEEIGKLRRVFRLRATRSYCDTFWALAKVGTVIKSGSKFYSETIEAEVYNPNDITVSASACSEAYVLTKVARAGETYGLTINGKDYTYDVQSGDTVADIHAALLALMVADTTKTYTVEDVGSGTSRYFSIIANSGENLSISSLTTRMLVETVKVYFYVEAVEAGYLEIPATFIDSIRTPVSGLTKVGNLRDFTVGRDLETESSFRARVENGSVSDYAGTYESIRQAIITNVPNVEGCEIYVNRDQEPTDSDGRPRGYYEVLVEGPASDEDIAAEVWRTAPINGGFFGNTTVSTLDGTGKSQFVKFSRPVDKVINVIMTYDPYDGATPPAGTDQAIVDTLLEEFSKLGTGQDWVANRMLGPLYSATKDIQINGINGSFGLSVQPVLEIAPSEKATLGVVAINGVIAYGGL